jgi:phosphoribosylamine-glycine ligase
MKIAFNSYTGVGAWFAALLEQEGHNVSYFLSKPVYENILCGIAPQPILVNGSNNPDYSNFDLSVFDLTGKQRQADYSASQCPTIGDGSFNSTLEDDRQFGIEVMEQAGIMVPPYERFDSTDKAKKLIRSTGKCYVYKPDTIKGQEQDTDTTFVSCSPEDMLEHIDKLFEDSKHAPFILQEFIKGCEVSTEGWFNGTEFYLRNSTLELKKFMNDDKGPATGCAGNMVWIHGLAEPKVYKQGLKKMIPYLQSIGYVGPLDLNSIATPTGLYGIEWTPRFGYDATACLANLYAGDFGSMLYSTATGEKPELAFRGEFCASVRLSIPPYPVKEHDTREEGNIVEGIKEEDYEHIYLYDLYKDGEALCSAGHNGFIASPMGIGGSPSEAFWELDKRTDKIRAAGLQYRTDVQKKICKRYCELVNEGWLSI